MKDKGEDKVATVTNDMGRNKRIFNVNNHSGMMEHIQSMLPSDQEIVILCIGTEKCPGDLLGPFTGTILKKNNCPYPVYGTLNDPAHALTLCDMIDRIQKNHDDPFIIAIDASLGTSKELGDIEVFRGGIKAGISVGNNGLPLVGNLSICGVTASGSLGFKALQNASFALSYKLQEIITKELMVAFSYRKLEREVS